MISWQDLSQYLNNCTEINSGSATVYPWEFPPKRVADSWSWWRHQMEAFFALLALCGGNSPATGEFPSQRPVTRSFDVFFDLHLNKRLNKQSRRRWFQKPSRPSWCHCNGDIVIAGGTSVGYSGILTQTVWRPTYLYDENPHAWKTVLILRRGSGRYWRPRSHYNGWFVWLRP